MKTPVSDFIWAYASSGVSRLHMPGHKGLVKEDITEIYGADSLYDDTGIIAQSEQNATALFGSARTLYATEGSSQCVKAMVFLLSKRGPILAARNAHQSFVHGAALCGADVRWLCPLKPSSPYSALITPEDLEKAIAACQPRPAALYVTSPDYLGREQALASLSAICRREGLCLACDNAHGAYLKFLTPSRHPMDLGADLCCDSAHKTLPVLTGGAYLHIGPHAPDDMKRDAKAAMALFGSSSPSWLILKSLDEANPRLETGFAQDLARAVSAVRAEKDSLAARGWQVLPSDEMRIVLSAAWGMSGLDMARKCRESGAECEFADLRVLVAMYTPLNREADFSALSRALGQAPGQAAEESWLPHLPRAAMPLREAVFAPWEDVPVADAAGRICALPLPHCPPAVPPVMPGEVIDDLCRDRLISLGSDRIRVVREALL